MTTVTSSDSKRHSGTVARLLDVALGWRRTAARHGRLTSYRDRYWIAAALSWLPLSLPWLIRLFGSDKESDDGHDYASTYHAVLRSFRYRRIKLLEIGVLKGESLIAWRSYFPRATIIGCDIDPKPDYTVGRIRTYVTDQGSREDLDALSAAEGPFDIIIDDGSHLNEHQILTFYTLFDQLRDGGVYVIEDIQTSFWPWGYGGVAITDPAFPATCVGEVLELAKYLNHAEFLTQDGLDARRLAFARKIRRIAIEHNLIVIWKGPNERASNMLHVFQAAENPSVVQDWRPR